VSLLVYSGDLGLEDGTAQSIYVLDKDKATQVEDEDGKPFRLDLSVGETIELPDGLGSVTFDRVDPWVRVQISQTPGKEIALLGVVLALIGLCASLYLRPRRVWVRARTVIGAGPGDTMITVVEVAGLDRSGNGDLDQVLSDLVDALQKERT
jgi:cytochrome c biogenesis protein